MKKFYYFKNTLTAVLFVTAFMAATFWAVDFRSLLGLVVFLLFAVLFLVSILDRHHLSTTDDELRDALKTAEKLRSDLAVSEASIRAKNAFLSSVANDIRLPLHASARLVEQAKESVDDRTKLLDSLDRLSASNAQLRAIMGGLFDLSRADDGKIEIDPEPTDLRRCEDEFLSIVKALAARDHIAVRVDLADVTHPCVKADTRRLNHAILNLLSNAVKYSEPDGTVRYTVLEKPGPRRGTSTYEFIVEDHGLGMSPEFAEKAFDAFTRGPAREGRKDEGVGLGLAITKKYAEAMGGTVTVESEPGKGSTFTIRVPLEICSQRTVRAHDKADPAKSGSTENRRILLVEDNALNREMAVDLLAAEGIDVETAENGALAVGLVGKKGPDYYRAILMDLQMPIMDGYEATRAIRELFPGRHIPIVALSANVFSEPREKSFAAGLDDHIAKPLDPADLKEILGRYQ